MTTEDQAIARMIAPGTKRKKIWRNGVLQIFITRACDKKCFHCTQNSQMAGAAAKITPEQLRQALESLNFKDGTGPYFGVVGAFGGNPCAAKGTRVYTTAGIFAIEDLENKVFAVRNQRGEVCPATCWLSGKGRRLYEVKLRGGHSHFVTADHEWPAVALGFRGNAKRKDLANYNPSKQVIPLGKVKTIDLQPGMRLPIGASDFLGFGADGDEEDGFLAGWILGDGSVSVRKLPRSRIRVNGEEDKRFAKNGRVRHVTLIVNTTDAASGVATRLQGRIKQLGSLASFRAVNKCHELGVSHTGVDVWMDKFGLLGKKEGLPTATWSTASEEFRKGMIDGLFSADGSVEVSKVTGHVRVRLASSQLKLTTDVADLLSFYGIKSQISKRVREGSFPNGKDYGRTYTSYTLSICGTRSVERFARLFPLTHVEKNRRLQDVVGKFKADVASTNIEIVSITPTDRYEDVWDISVSDDTHTFQIAHCVTGNCLHPQFEELCSIFREYVPFEQRGIWSNHPRGQGAIMRQTFNPKVSNLNVHESKEAYDEFAASWPECKSELKGLKADSRHTPALVAMQDLDVLPGGVENTEANRLTLIADCDINKYWSAMICPVRNELRAFFCELAAAQAMLHQNNQNWMGTGQPMPDTGLPVTPGWWREPMESFRQQVRVHCHACGIPLRGYGALANAGPHEQISETHMGVSRMKDSRQIMQITQLVQLGADYLGKATDYIENGGV